MRFIPFVNTIWTLSLLRRSWAQAEAADPTSGYSPCRTGYTRTTNAQCVDDDECNDAATCPGSSKLTCVNTPGSYRCECPPGLQGNGIDSCGYVLPIIQAVKTLNFAMKEGKTVVFNRPPHLAIRRLESLLKENLNSIKVTKIVIKTITKTSMKHPVWHRVTYDLHTNDVNFSFEQFAKLFNRRKKERSPAAIWLRKWRPPRAESQRCTSATLGSGKHKFKFQTTKVNSTAYSQEKCPGTETPKAEVQCTQRKQNKVFFGYFNITTLQILNCTEKTNAEMTVPTTPLPSSTTNVSTTMEITAATTLVTTTSILGTTGVVVTVAASAIATASTTVDVTTTGSTSSPIVSASATASDIPTTTPTEALKAVHSTTTNPAPPTGSATTTKVRKQASEEPSIEELLRRFLKALTNSTYRESKKAFSKGRNMLISAAQRIQKDKNTEVTMLALDYGVQIVDWLIENPGKVEVSKEENFELVLSFEKLPVQVTLKNESKYEKDGKSLSIEVRKIDRHSIVADEYSSGTNSPSTSIRASVPEEAIQRAMDSTLINASNVGFIYYKNSSMFSISSETPEYENSEISQVISASVSNAEIQNLTQDFWFQIPIKKDDVGKRKARYFRCAFLDEKTRNWSTEGCYFVQGSNPPNCSCDHLTNFAVIVKNVELLDTYALGIFGKVGCSISIVGLTWMLACYLASKSLRKIQINRLHANLCGCLLMSYLVFLIGVEKSEHKIGCIAVAAVLHFFLLAAWGWMCVECITMYRKLVTVFGHTGDAYVAKSAAVVYPTSFAIVCSTLAVVVAWYDKKYMQDWDEDIAGENRFNSFYVSERLCWLRGYPLYLGFLTPVGLAFIFNTYAFIRITKAITCDREKVPSSRKTTLVTEMKDYLVRAIMITFLLGLSWAFAIPLAITDDPITNQIFSWLFSIFNSLQGFFVFFFFCAKRKDVRELWMGGFKNSITRLRNKPGKSNAVNKTPCSPKTRKTCGTTENTHIQLAKIASIDTEY